MNCERDEIGSDATGAEESCEAAGADGREGVVPWAPAGAAGAGAAWVLWAAVAAVVAAVPTAVEVGTRVGGASSVTARLSVHDW